MLNSFKSITGNEPFPWQKRLYHLLANGKIPRSLDIPTGLGKTSILALWLLARAAGAPLPRRLIYIVDRRAVIDQSTKIAEELREWLRGHPEIAGTLGLQEGKSIPISTLRGQHVDNREWLEDPSAPAIIIGTVDLIGSRLLFEGYRCSRKMRPYHAGLLGADCLYILDEAHLVPSFERLLERVILDGDDFSPRQQILASPPKLYFLSLSATGNSKGGASFSLGAKDTKHSVVAKRLGAKKQVQLESIEEKDKLFEKVAEQAWKLSDNGANPIRCLVFTNKREDAEKAYSYLQKLAAADKKKNEPKADVELLVGGRRIFERVASAKRLEELGFLAGSNIERTRPAFLFATSAGEVGIDLDADHLVCDLVQWERMIQRLGRVNRRGEGDAKVIIFREPMPTPTKSQQAAINSKVKKKKGDEDKRLKAIASYQSSVTLWRTLACPFEQLPQFGGDKRDGSPGAFRDLQRRAHNDEELALLLKDASSPAPLFPRLDRATLDAWAMTSLEEHAGRPIVAPWLRGWIEDTPQTAIVWRTHLPLDSDGKVLKRGEVKRFFKAAPPHLSEVLEVESFRVADWVCKRAIAASKQPAQKDTNLRSTDVVAFFIDANGEFETWTLRDFVVEAEKKSTQKTLVKSVLPGQTIVLDSRIAGLLANGLLDANHSAAPKTADSDSWLDDIDGEPPIRYRVHSTGEATATKDKGWRERERFPTEQKADGEVSKWLVVDKWRHDTAIEDDRSAGPAQILSEHQAWAAKHATNLASRLGLSKDAARLLTIAARLHDEGKRAKRWQRAFNAPQKHNEVYAKTLGPVNVRALEGYRHEFGSLPYAERDDEVKALPFEQQDLVLHLIASHHGNARPVIRTTGDDDAPPSSLQERACEVALRFARLQQMWGPWGLAWWESLLRASDVLASRDNETREKTDPEATDG
ncbi:MAG: type I-U CRISPR-associated helicase/endonuclease Cas3 [Deltaproteobacteria bacterium]|nr:type I-U CRISPR-associated helicase/endonuclease Cas3 [Deltaproteobacteria bacterium]